MRWFVLVLLLISGWVYADDITQGDTRWFYRYIDQETGGESFETYSWGDSWWLSHLGSGLEMIRVQENQSEVFIPQGRLIIGDSGVTAGALTLSGSALTLRSQGNLNLGANGVNYRWPTADGTSGQVIQTNGSGVLSFASAAGGNSFETIAVPAGTNPVADSSTDTLTITETSPLVITGTAGTDTIDITWTTLTVAEGGTGATSLTDGGILLGSGTGAITPLGVAANGEIPIGDGTTDPVLGTIGGTTNEIEVTNGAGTITVGIPTSPVFTTSAEVSGAVPRYVLTDTTTGDDDFEIWADADILGLANTTNGSQIWRTTTAGGFQTIGKLTTEGGADLNGTVDARAATVVALVEQESKTIFDPDTVQTTTDAIPLFEVDAYKYPFGITIHQVKLSVNASASPAYNLEEWTSPTDGAPSTILNMQLSSETERTWRSFADASIAAGSFIMVDLDTTALNWAIISVWYSANTS